MRAILVVSGALEARSRNSSVCLPSKHGQPKQLYLRAVRKNAAALLRQGRLPAELAEYEQNLSGPCPLRAEALGSLLDLFKTLKDKRRGHGLRHRQAFVLACATVAMLMGAGLPLPSQSQKVPAPK